MISYIFHECHSMPHKPKPPPLQHTGFLKSMLCSKFILIADWNATEYREFGCIPVRPDDYKLALPMVLMFLTPKPVAVIGIEQCYEQHF